MWESLGAAVALVAVLIVLLKSRPQRQQKRWLPDALRGATLAYAETTFRSKRRSLVARVDRAYRLGGHVVLVELKTRAWNAAFHTDVIELSVQRAALEDQTGEVVSRFTWVLVENSSTKQRLPHRMELLSDKALDALITRYRQVRGRQAVGLQPAARTTMCLKCGHLERCRDVYKDHPAGA